MSERTKLGLGVIEAALILGLLGDALLRATPWGLNVFLWTAALAAGAYALSRQKGARAGVEARWRWPVVLMLSAFFAWRDSIALRMLDTLAVCGVLSIIALGARGGRVRAAGLFEYVLAGVASALNAMFGVFPLVFSDVKWKEIPRKGWSKHAFAVARGLLIAVPLLLLFGALFVAADAVYEGLIQNTFAFDGEVIFTHALLFTIFAWLTGGFLRGMLLAERPITDFAGMKQQTFASPIPLTQTAKTEQTGAKETVKPRPSDEVNASRNEEKGDGSLRADDAQPPVAPPGQSGYRFSAGDEEDTRGHRGFGLGDFAREETAEEIKTKGEKISAGESTRTQESATGRKEQQNASVEVVEAGVRPSLGIVEVGVVMGLLDLLFFSFVAVQLRYFFGDAQHVITSAGLTFSDYARRGFFELVWVALLALPLMLAAHWLLRKENPTHEKIFRALAGAMTAMLFIIMASAVWRMRLYQEAYGQTELRFYTTAFMIWLGIVLAWFVLTVLRGRRERFAFGAVVAWLVVLGALHFVNPGGMIARANVEHAREKRGFERFDEAYASSLGPDAMPALLPSLPEMSQRDRAYVSARLIRWLDDERQTDWRSWNYSRMRARRLIEADEATLRGWAARWEEEIKAERERAAQARAQAASYIQSAVAPLPGTQFFIHVERRASASPSTFLRSATLVSGDTPVSSLTLPSDDGVRTRIELVRVSATQIILQDAYGVYTADLERRSFSPHQDSVGAARPAVNIIGAFDLDTSRTWRFTLAQTTVPPAPQKAKEKVKR